MQKENKSLAIINSTVAEIKLKPEFNSEMADEGLFGMVVEVLEDLGQWKRIQTHYRYQGYIHKDDLVIDNNYAIYWKDNAQAEVSHAVIDVMAAPKYQSYRLNVLTRGARIISTGNTEEQWAEVVLPNDKKGWVRKDHLGSPVNLDIKKDDEEVIRQKLVKTAMFYLGTQYRWGGKSPLGIDCSGLCSVSYLLNGIIIYRDAHLKKEYMKEISLEEIKPGDLLYFPGHVAMYIGDDKYIHSTSKSSGVVINSLNPKDRDYRKDLRDDIIAIGTIFKGK
ncbi:NlpC/P60 family protein [Clostridiisalibacter paucivorans]|uniref:C40 family peptidase n=1 Tax=Clostridiisalibacter paucivorans TaxID=408753 RepID=UPI00047C3D02|nr:NlpC/P60 family protein [Clostridiisalibacter paucivorans]